MIVAVVAIGVLGLIVGSFLNVVVHRVPAGLSIVSPPSACPRCGNRIRPYDNIPVLSWLLLRGRCRDCGEPISVRYPLVELATGVLFAVVAVTFAGPLVSMLSGDAGRGVAAQLADVLVLVAFLYLAAVSIALALIDLDVRRLPNVIVLPAYVVGAVLLAAAAALGGDGGSLLAAALGAVAYFVLHFLLAFFWTGALGMGDVKLSGVLGLFLGWLGVPELVVGLLAAFILGGLFGVILLIAGRGRTARIAYGPWMLLGAWVGILLGSPLASWYLGAFGLG